MNNNYKSEQFLFVKDIQLFLWFNKLCQLHMIILVNNIDGIYNDYLERIEKNIQRLWSFSWFNLNFQRKIFRKIKYLLFCYV